VTRYSIEPASSQVWISGSSSVHPIHATATGLEGWVDATERELAGEVRIDVDRLKSGNGLVDRETRRRIDAARFPQIVGIVTSAEPRDGGRFAVAGTVAFRGVECEVEGQLDIALRDGLLVIEGEQTFDVRDWGLEPPRLALLKVHPEVDVRIHVEAHGV
jgi:polyisoprenoid-binding protein YceI